MIRFVLLLLLQALVVFYVFPAIDSDFRVRGEFGNAVLVVLIFAVLNSIFRWLLVILTLGIGYLAYYLTFGLLGLFINAAVLICIDVFFQDLLTVPSYWMAFAGGFLLALVGFVLGKSR